MSAVWMETKQAEENDGPAVCKSGHRTDTLIQEDHRLLTFCARAFQAMGMASAKDLRQGMYMENFRRSKGPMCLAQGE